ncbi:Pre-mRNA splicing factor SR-like 1 [Hirschfeldia incana]|nr:Pre-mRNA splicing factor SR-like 1 [Hirschfeldia incana]
MDNILQISSSQEIYPYAFACPIHLDSCSLCEFAPGSNGRTTTMGVYVRDLLLGLYYFDTLFPRIPVPVMRQIVSNLEKMNLPTKPSGSTGDMSRGSEDTARRPPSVKASLSVSFGQRAPHRASTRGSSPVRRPPPSGYDRNERDEPQRRSPRRSQSRDYYSDRDSDRQRGERERERERDRYRERERDYGNDRRSRRDYESSRSRRSDYEDDSRSRHDRRSRSRSRSRSVQMEREPTPKRDYGNKEKAAAASVNSNLAKLKDLYGDASNQKGEEGYGTRRDSSSEEVIKLGGSSWR